MKALIKRAPIMTLLFVFLSVVLFAHNGKEHGKPKRVDSLQTAASHHDHSHMDQDQVQIKAGTQTPHAHELDTFPTLHPLVVHFPIVLLMLAALLQWVGLVVYKKEMITLAWVLLLLGFVGAYASSTWFHAHTGELSPSLQALLEEHEKYASYTQWLAGIALVIQSANLLFMKRNAWINAFMALVMTGSAVFVAYTGHHGAELVHKHGIGAKGYLLEQHHHHH